METISALLAHCERNPPVTRIPLTRATLIARFMGPTWGPSGADRTQVGPMLAPWTLLSGQWVTRSFDVFFDVRLNWLNSQWSCRWFETPRRRSLWRQCNVWAENHLISYFDNTDIVIVNAVICKFHGNSTEIPWKFHCVAMEITWQL